MRAAGEAGQPLVLADAERMLSGVCRRAGDHDRAKNLAPQATVAALARADDVVRVPAESYRNVPPEETVPPNSAGGVALVSALLSGRT